VSELEEAASERRLTDSGISSQKKKSAHVRVEEWVLGETVLGRPGTEDGRTGPASKDAGLAGEKPGCWPGGYDD